MNTQIFETYLKLEASRKELAKQVAQLEKEISPLKAAILEAIPSDSDQLLVSKYLATIKKIKVESMISKADAIEAHGLQWLNVNGLLKTRIDTRLSVCELQGVATLKAGA